MIQYLEYLKRIFFTTGTKYIGIILSELTLYQKVYLKIEFLFMIEIKKRSHNDFFFLIKL